MRPQISLIIVLIAVAAGFMFSAVSTYDSVAHLDRQVHGIHCSYLLGLGTADATGSSGCHATLMSPYSSVFRQTIWGGIPVALPGMSVFCFLFFWGMWILMMRRQNDKMATLFLVAGTVLPVLTSVYMGYLAIVTLKAACKLCIGIYISSLIAFLGALRLWIVSRKQPPLGDDDESNKRELKMLSLKGVVVAFILGVLFVAVPVVTYAAAAPDYSNYIGKCGSLSHMQDAERVLVPIGQQGLSREIVEVLDPLCNSCRSFEHRYDAMPISKGISRRILLFPLDKTCNWMLGESIHPGACAVSEAVLCAGNDAQQVINWAFDEQESILEQAKNGTQAVTQIITARFPELRRCIGSTGVRAKLNLALRWAVKNQLQVLTPQVYVERFRLCDEDSDLGLDYALPRLISRTDPSSPSRLQVPQEIQTTPQPTAMPQQSNLK
jgi:uncharacterized membrane protein